MRRRIIGLILLINLLAVQSLLAQQPNTTPTATEVPAITPTRTPFDPSIQLDPLTQSDLEITTGNVQRPNGIVWYNNNLYAACTGDMTLYEIDSVTGQTLTYIAGVQNAHTLYAEAEAGNNFSLWVPDFGTNELLNITRTGIRRVSDGLRGPWGIAPFDEETFLITNIRSNELITVTHDGEQAVILDTLASPTGLAVDDDYIYVGNNGSTRRAIEWYPREIVEGEALEQESSVLVSGLQNTTGVVLAPDGYLYFAYSLGTRGVVGRVDPDYCRENGGCTNEDVQLVIYTELEAPLAGLSVTPDMRLFVHTMFQPEIYWAQIDF